MQKVALPKNSKQSLSELVTSNLIKINDDLKNDSHAFIQTKIVEFELTQYNEPPLPGQYEDIETDTHYNYYSDYDSAKGVDIIRFYSIKENGNRVVTEVEIVVTAS